MGTDSDPGSNKKFGRKSKLEKLFKIINPDTVQTVVADTVEYSTVWRNLIRIIREAGSRSASE
jgi:hypothetical protein